MPDYTIKLFLKNGQVRQTDYDRLIQALGIKDHDALSLTLGWSKLDKIRYLVGQLKEKYPEEVESFKIYDEAGQEIYACP